MSVVNLTQMRAHLNIGDNRYDDEITAMIAAAEAVIGNRVGPLSATAVTARVRGGGFVLALPTKPAVSLTSVTPVGGTAVTLGDLYLNTASALVSYSSTGTGFSSADYDVVYQAGRATCPDDLLMAVKELVRHMWKTQRGPTRRPGSEPSEALANTLPGAAYMLPIRVSELLAPHMLMTVGA